MPTVDTHASAVEFSPSEWDWVQSLIHDIEKSEKREEFAKFLFQWDLAVKEFRKMEQKRLLLQEPTETDLRHHAICLHMLLAMGHFLVSLAEDFSESDLAKFDMRHAQIKAYVEELEENFREWHHGFTEAEMTQLQSAIFGG